MPRNSRPRGVGNEKRRRMARKRRKRGHKERKQMVLGNDPFRSRQMCHSKHRYASELGAMIAAEAIMRHRGVTLRTYHCPKCHGWHLTHRRNGHDM